VVTGAAAGIGRAIAERAHADGARGVTVADLDEAGARRTAEDIGGLGLGCDVGDPGEVARLIAAAEERFGPVDVLCSNAGFSDPPGELTARPPEAWRRIVDVNLLAHVWAAELVLPGMVERGGGGLLQTISSAALITGPSGPGYTLTKHGALGFAEWVALNYGPRGIRVTCLCPNAVWTGMLGRDPADRSAPPPDAGGLGEVLTPEAVADAGVDALREGRFLALPHPRVGVSFGRKGQDYDGWIAHTAGRLAALRGTIPSDY
jgi:NAD(P)-dependent dehydrogenase (short-subunit alcohol dehydrogenase family)